MRRSALAAAFALCAGAASASCPTAADLEGDGIWIDYSDGSLVRYQRLKEEVVGEINYQPEGVESFFTARYRGIWLLLDAPLKNDLPDEEEIMSFQPDAGQAEWPAIAPGASWNGEVVTRRKDGSFVNRFSMKAEVVGTDAVSISSCVYEADVVRVEENFGDDNSASEVRYLHGLGVAYIAASGKVGEDFEFFATPTWIGTEAPR